jgi:hypothetical protein
MSTRNRYDFVTLIQTIILHQRPPLEIALRILEETMALPDEAIPKDLRGAAFNIWQWQMGRADKPSFIVDYEDTARRAQEEQEQSIRIRINHDVDCQSWWMHAESLSEAMPRACRDIVCGRGVKMITVPRATAEAFRDWGSGIPGWDDGPPFVFERIDGSPVF